MSLLFTAGHTLGGRSSWSPVGENEVLVSMRTVHFHFQTLSRSFLDFYRGFGYSLGVFLVLQGIVLWQLAAITRTQPQVVRPLVASFGNRIHYRRGHHLDFHLSNSGDVFRRVCRLSCDRVRHTPLIERQLGVFLGDSSRH